MWAPTAHAQAEAAARRQPVDGDAPLNVAFVWHQHQPLYTDPATGEAFLPWVRMHAIKDYYDMAAMLQDYPSLRATFNLVPSLIDQLLAYYDGEPRDLYEKMALIPADQLTDDEKAFLLQALFRCELGQRRRPLSPLQGASGQAGLGRVGCGHRRGDERASPSKIIGTCKCGSIWRGLTPTSCENDPELAALVRRGRDFTEADKQVIRAKQMAIIREVLPLHRQMQETGQIEIITTPYAHPILPLLYDTDVAHVASPDLPLPGVRFSYPEDIARHLERAVDNYRTHFGREPKGLWPSEQAVSKYIVPYVAPARALTG